MAVADLIARYAFATLGLLAVIAATPRVWPAWRTRGRQDNHGEVTNHRVGTPRIRQDFSRLPIADQLAGLRRCGGAIYIVAHKAKMVDARDGGSPSDP